MIVCPNCGTGNTEDSRFCANCGANLRAGRTGPSDQDPAPTDQPPSIAPTAPEWRMSPAGPLPEPPRRRTWLWVLLGTIGALLLLCCLVGVWLSTAGSDQLDNLATWAAEEATKQAGQ